MSKENSSPAAENNKASGQTPSMFASLLVFIGPVGLLDRHTLETRLHAYQVNRHTAQAVYGAEPEDADLPAPQLSA